MFCWCYFLSFFNVAPVIRQRVDGLQRECCVKTVDETITTAKNLVNFGQGTLPWQPILWRETAKRWHTPPLLFVLAYHNGLEDRKTYTHTKISDEPCTYCKHFMNFSAVNP